MFKLLIQSTASSTPNMPVRWCFHPADLESLAREGIEDPQILLVTRGQGDYAFEQRFLTSVVAAEQYVQFNSVGDNILLALVVSSSERGLLKKTFLSRSGTGYAFSLFDSDGEFIGIENLLTGGANGGIVIYWSDSLTVSITEEFFAKEKPLWLRNWINREFYGSVANSCHEGKRMLWAFSGQAIGVFLLKPVIALIYALFRLAIGRSQGINLWPIINPLRYDIEEVKPVRWGRDKISWGNPWLIPITPLFTFLVGACTLLIANQLDLPTVEWWWFFLALPVLIYSFALAVVTFGLLWILLDWLMAGFQLSKKRPERNREVTVPRYLRRQDILICDTAPRYEPIPVPYRTFSLRYQALKARVCKPFAR